MTVKLLILLTRQKFRFQACAVIDLIFCYKSDTHQSPHIVTHTNHSYSKTNSRNMLLQKKLTNRNQCVNAIKCI